MKKVVADSISTGNRLYMIAKEKLQSNCAFTRETVLVHQLKTSEEKSYICQFKKC